MAKPSFMSCRLYLITPPKISDLSGFCDGLKPALQAGGDLVACLQLRLKEVDDATILSAAKAILPICEAAEVSLLINDRPDLAKKAGAHGAHIGQSDMGLKEARALLGEGASIGVTCHNSRHLALEAGEQGADYVAFGAFFPTKTKETDYTATPALIEWWTHATTVPSVAIGGITPENCKPIADAGADFIAVSGAVWGHPAGPAAAIRDFQQILA